ncbi:hypothetical protein BH10BAC5_BH10BAC5_06260 [soil metagenome]
MSIFFKALGKSSFGLLLIRLSLGTIFLIGGASKILNLQAFVDSVKANGFLPEKLAMVFGFILPFAEMFLGSFFIIGFMTPVVSFFLSLLILSFLLALPNKSELAISYNWVFLSCTIFTMFAGAGALSFDAIIDRKKKTEIIVSPKVISPPIKENEVIVTDSNVEELNKIK